jgi:CubicO group peptidase (beta-lactamase class C family)
VRGARSRAWLFAVALAAVPGAAASSATLDAADLDAFFAGALGGLMAERHVPGAVVLVVKDGDVLFARGYGAADLATGRPVDPETTLFRVASVSKLFTATAVMQLVEQGKLDLDADVNGYLEEFQVPKAFAAPITLRHLLTHTPGFDDSFLHGTEPLGPEPMMPLGAYLARHLPPRVQPPGAPLSYSNHGIALAGHVVEQVSGQAFGDYVREHVFAPLGMTRSGFSLPSPPPPELAVGYDWKDGRYQAVSLDRMRMAPAGDLYSSAGEIARFMAAHLADGRAPGGDARILREETARAMHAQAFTHHPELTGWCLGFEERRWNGVRAIGHGGSWNGYGTELVLVPEAGLGLFVSTTRSNDPRFFRPLLRAFFDRYFPAPEPAPAAAAPDAVARARAAAGTYVPNRHVRGDLLKLGLLLGSLRVTAHEDGSLTLATTGDAFDPFDAVPAAGGTWRSERENLRVALLPAADGAPQRIAIDAWAFDRVAWWRDPELHRTLLGACALVFAATLLGFALGAGVRLFAGQPASPVPATVRAVAAAAAGLSLAVLAAIGIGLTALSPFALFLSIPLWLRAAGLLPFLSIPLSLALLLLLVRDGRRWTPLARLSLAALTAALAVFAALAWSYNLIGLG